jgi:Glycosyl hydrolases family 25
MTNIDERAAQWGEAKLGVPLTAERELLPGSGIFYRCYFNATLWDYPGAGVYTVAEASVADRFLGAISPPLDPTATVEALDVASYQPRDLTALINSCQPRPQHIVVHLYIEWEGPPAQHSIDQINSARANGCTAGGYLFCYPGADPRQSVRDALDVANAAGLALPVLWLDVETYEHTLVGTGWLTQAVDESGRHGQPCGIYTSQGMWEQMGNPTAFASLPLWNAAWNGTHDLVMPVPYGGWSSPSAGHQYGGDPLDRNVFAAEMTI